MNSIISFVIVLGVLIFVHEFGHFITAKLFRIKVLKFSLGFGPKLISKLYGETEYLISALPLGGYVKMVGELPNETVEEKDMHRSFAFKPVWQRFLVVLAGPLFNILFAVFVFFFIYAISGIPEPVKSTVIGQITQGSPADKAGILPGDIILSIDNNKTEEWSDVSKLIRDGNGKEISLTLKRGDDTLVLIGKPAKSDVKNLFGEVVDHRYLLGISKKDEVIYKKSSLLKSFTAGVQQTWMFIHITILSIIKIFQRVIPASEIGGPIMIASMAGQQFEAGWISLCSFMGVLSINLGVINLFPIPILDGGHLVFFSVEALRRKPLSMQSQEMLQQIGIVLLGTLMIFVFYNDFARLFSG